MNLWQNLSLYARVLVTLRRLERHTDTIAKALTTLADIEAKRYAHESRIKVPQKYSPSVMNLEEAEKEFTRRRNEGAPY